MVNKILLTLGFLANVLLINAQNTIGIIDFYGNRKISAATINQVLPIKVGDSINRKTFNKELITSQLKKNLPIQQAIVNVTCCTEKNEQIIFIGIDEIGKNQLKYNKAPHEILTLPKDMVAAYDSLLNTVMEAIQSGQANEDYSQGHSLVAYPKSRALQEQFINYASQTSLLRNTLENAADAKQRAVAAHIIAYAKDKRQIVSDLLNAVRDSDEEVRNNATRALSIIVQYSQAKPELKIHIPAEPFIKMLNSNSWTDRNKGAAVLFHLSKSREAILFKQLREEALESLIEMAKWKSKDHAGFSFIILARIAGLEEEKLFETLYSDSFSSVLEQIIIKVKAQP
jgi:hypothetical protein